MASRPVNVEKFGLRRVRKPFVQGGLSSTLLIEGAGHINIGFNQALVKRAGLILPRGISPTDPAFMSIGYDIVQEHYVIHVRYLDERKMNEKYKLLVLPERPVWLSPRQGTAPLKPLNLKRNENDQN